MLWMSRFFEFYDDIRNARRHFLHAFSKDLFEYGFWIG